MLMSRPGQCDRFNVLAKFITALPPRVGPHRWRDQLLNRHCPSLPRFATSTVCAIISCNFPSSIIVGVREIEFSPQQQVIISLDKGGQERFPGLPSSPYVYFVHSYYPVPENRSIIAATAEYCEWISFVPPEIRIARCQLRYRLPQHWEPQNCRKFFEQRH